MSIYCFSTLDTIIYVGSTTNFSSRYSSHKNKFKYNFDMPFYNYLRDNNIELTNLIYTKLNDNYIDDKVDLLKMENVFMEKLKPICNNNRAIIDDNDRKIYQQNYRRTNIDYFKNYRIINSNYFKNYLSNYRANNKEKIKNYQKNYRLIHKGNLYS